MRSLMLANSLKGMLATLAIAGVSISCAGSPLGDTVGQSLEADPQLEQTPNPNESDESDQATATDNANAAVADSQANSSSSRPNSSTAAESVTGPRDFDWIDSEPDASEQASENDDTDPSEATVNTLDGVPEELQTYIRDLQVLGLLEIRDHETGDRPSASTGGSSTNSNPANPVADSDDTADANAAASQPDAAIAPFNQTATRREYARWLWETHNALYEDDASVRIRAGVASDDPIFQDVPATDPDFDAIQGLASAGVIPSTLTGSTAVTFRPEAPLARQTLILWKVPLDTRTALPNTTQDAVQETWGFQDTGKVDPIALRAIAADFQLGDLANIRRAFGYTTLFRPNKSVTRAEVAAVLWRFGELTEGRSAAEVGSEGAGGSEGSGG